MQPDAHDENVDVPFRVPFVHKLRFTRDVFGADTHVLENLFEASADQPARVQFWLDETLEQKVEWLRPAIESFFDARSGRVIRASNIQLVPGGEAVKNDVHLLERMLKVMNAANLDRRSYVAVIGGGAVLDAVGFAAAIAHRGIRLVRLPTTTLAQADSGIGVKNGVNLFGKKNWIGSFAVPWGVVNDARLLETLSSRDYRCGFSEAVKVSLLKDPALFDAICRSTAEICRRDATTSHAVIAASAKLHLDHITRGGDPFEMLEARPLDFGHWSAHKLETVSEFRLRHGEAVAVGLAIDVVYSSLKLGLPESQAKRVLDCLTKLGFVLGQPELDRPAILFDGLEEFRQHLGGRLTITLLEEIGKPVDVHEIDRPVMREAIRRVAALRTSVVRTGGTVSSG